VHNTGQKSAVKKKSNASPGMLGKFSGHGLAGMKVLGWPLDLMILEVFSNLNDSMIL